MVDVWGGYTDDLKKPSYKMETVIDKVKNW